MTETQLRIYTIKPGRLDDFVRAWTDGVLPLRRRFEFEIEAWTVPGEDTFVWIMRYGGPGSFEDADRAYYASPERSDLNPDPVHWIASTEKRSLRQLEGTVRRRD